MGSASRAQEGCQCNSHEMTPISTSHEEVGIQVGSIHCSRAHETVAGQGGCLCTDPGVHASWRQLEKATLTKKIQIKIVGCAILIINGFCFAGFNYFAELGLQPRVSYMVSMHTTAKISHKPSGFYVFQPGLNLITLLLLTTFSKGLWCCFPWGPDFTVNPRLTSSCALSSFRSSVLRPLRVTMPGSLVLYKLQRRPKAKSPDTVFPLITVFSRSDFPAVRV